MKKTAVVFWSGTGNTESMANAVLEGMKAAGAEAELFTSEQADAAKLALFDAIAFGCPAMGAEELEETEFAPMFDAVKGSLSGKDAALFGSYGWGDGEWMRNWEETCLGDGAVFAGDSVICNEAPDDEADAACIALGKKLAGE